MNKTFKHELVEEFRYSKSGDFDNATFIEVTAPKSSDFYEGLQVLDSLYNRAELKSLKSLAGVLKELEANDTQKEKAKEQAEEMSEDEKAINAYNQIMSGLDEKEIKCLNICICELLKKSALVNGEDKFEALFFEDMDIDDRRLIIGKYLVNFTSSAQRNSKKH